MSTFIAHYGTKGMKWGVVNEDESTEEATGNTSSDYNSKTSRYKELRDKYTSKLGTYREEINNCLNDMSGITDRKEMIKQINKFNQTSAYYNKLKGSLDKLNGVIENREKTYTNMLNKANKKKTTKSKTKSVKYESATSTIKPTGKFYKPTSKKKIYENIADTVKDLQNKRKS